MPKIKVNRDSYLDNEEVLESIKNSNNKQVRAIMALLWLSGARISEVLQLKGRDLNKLDNEEALIIKMPTLKRRNKSAVNRKRRVKIPTDNLFFQYFRTWVNNRRPLEEQRIFTYSRQWVWEKMKEANPDIYPHFFRHSFYTKLGDKADAFTLKAHADWANLETANKYVHPKDAPETIFQLEKKSFRLDESEEDSD